MAAAKSCWAASCVPLPPQRRASLTVATKLAPFPWRLGRGGFRRAFDASRRRLQGKLDRVQLHWSTARYAPWQEAPLLEGLADLVSAGEVAGLGLSNMGPRRLRQVQARLAERGIPILSLQVQLSLLAPEPIAADGVAAVCRELGIALIAYSPLALGAARPVPWRGGAIAAGAPGRPVNGGCCRRPNRCCRPCGRSLAAREATPWRRWRSTGAGPMAPCRSRGLRRLEQVEAAAAAPAGRWRGGTSGAGSSGPVPIGFACRPTPFRAPEPNPARRWLRRARGRG